MIREKAMDVKKYFGKRYLYRYLIVIVSMMLNGLGVALMRISCMGTDPFSSMNYSFSEFFHIPLGTVVILVSCILLGLSFFTMRSSLGFGTVANMALLGTSADLWTSLITRAAGHEISFAGTEALALRTLLVCLGILCMIFFNSFYISANSGMSPYDALGFIIEKLSGGFPFKWARVVTDIVCVVIAYLVAGRNGSQWELIGIGTVIMAFGTGPLLSFFKEHIAQPFVRRMCDAGW